MKRQIKPNVLKKNIVSSYSFNIGFPVYGAIELSKIYRAMGVNPKSTDRRIFDLESLSHHCQREVVCLLNMMKIKKGDFLLDVGCGNGAPSRLITKMYGCKIMGIDLVPEQIRKARECHRLEGVSDLIKLKNEDVHNLDFEEALFHKIFHNESICHWHEKKIALKKLYKFLKKGGCMGFHDWLRGDRGSLNDAGGDFSGIYGEKVWFQSTLKENVELLEEAGFTVEYAEDISDVVDRSMRARLKELEISSVYKKVNSDEYFEKTLKYFKAMIWTNYKFLRYGRFLCTK